MPTTWVQVRAACYTGKKYLASVCGGTEVLYQNYLVSTDGSTWTDTGWGGWNPPSSLPYVIGFAVDTSSGVILGLTNDNKIMKIDDDVTSYSEIDPNFDKKAYCIGFGNGVWIAAGGQGSIHTSTDAGQTWTKRIADNSYTGTFRTVVYGDGIFIIAGDSGEIQYSTDNGQTWHHASAAGGYSGTFRGGCYSDTIEKYLLCGDNAEIQHADAPSSWTHKDAAGSFTGAFYGAVWMNPYFVLVGEDGEIQYIQVT